MPHANATAALVTLMVSSLASPMAWGWQTADAAPRQPLFASRGTRARRSQEGISLLINGRSQQALWRWIGASGQELGDLREIRR